MAARPVIDALDDAQHETLEHPAVRGATAAPWGGGANRGMVVGAIGTIAGKVAPAADAKHRRGRVLREAKNGTGRAAG